MVTVGAWFQPSNRNADVELSFGGLSRDLHTGLRFVAMLRVEVTFVVCFHLARAIVSGPAVTFDLESLWARATPNREWLLAEEYWRWGFHAGQSLT